ncbi:MAG: hypothetical protein V2A79_12375 [Planctomycetota bacterium]
MFAATLSSIAALIVLAGCAETWRPPMAPLRDVPPAAAFDLASYFPAATEHRRVYLRRNLRAPDAPAMIYARQLGGRRQRDGAFADREVGEWTCFVARPGEAEPGRYLDWPASDQDRWLGIFLEFDPPLEYLPMTLPTAAEAECRSALRVFDRWGHRFRTGTAKRTVRMEGHEDVVTDGVRFEACLRLVAETAIRVPWGPRVDVTEYLWLARGMGEVRRIEHIRALAFPLYFDEAYAYELAAGRLPVARQVSDLPPRPLVWARMMVLLDRFLPGLRLGGTVVEYAGPGPASQPTGGSEDFGAEHGENADE